MIQRTDRAQRGYLLTNGAPHSSIVMTGLSIPARDKINGTSVAMNIERSH